MASAIAETLWPTRCAGCNMPGTLLCDDCRVRLPRIDLATACPHCGAPYGYVTCTECSPSSGAGSKLRADDFAFAAARAACSYEGVAKRLVTIYKDQDEARLDEVLAELLCECVRGRGGAGGGLPEAAGSGGPQGADPRASELEPAPAAAPNCAGSPEASANTGGLPAAAECMDDWAAWADALVTIPANPDNLLRRGYDHMERIAALCSRELGLPLVNALTTTRAADQRMLSGKQRSANRSGSFALASAAGQLPQRILLIDDVFTTGATLNAAAQTLLDGGAAEVRAAVVARVW